MLTLAECALTLALCTGGSSEDAGRAPWRLGLKVAWDINTPGLAVPLQTGDCYYLRGTDLPWLPLSTHTLASGFRTPLLKNVLHMPFKRHMTYALMRKMRFIDADKCVMMLKSLFFFRIVILEQFPCWHHINGGIPHMLVWSPENPYGLEPW